MKTENRTPTEEELIAAVRALRIYGNGRLVGIIPGEDLEQAQVYAVSDWLEKTVTEGAAR